MCGRWETGSCTPSRCDRRSAPILPMLPTTPQRATHRLLAAVVVLTSYVVVMHHRHERQLLSPDW
jgi:hypothetical protein